jgi:hypothetical protein
MAFEFAVKGISGCFLARKSAGYYWFKGFLRRHPKFVMKKAENLSAARAMAMNRRRLQIGLISMKRFVFDLV